MKTTIVNGQLNIRPKIRPNKVNAKDSHITANLVPVICWIDNASEERRALIAPELFSDRSK